MYYYIEKINVKFPVYYFDREVLEWVLNYNPGMLLEKPLKSKIEISRLYFQQHIEFKFNEEQSDIISSHLDNIIFKTGASLTSDYIDKIKELSNFFFWASENGGFIIGN